MQNFPLYLKKAGLASRNIVHVQKTFYVVSVSAFIFSEKSSIINETCGCQLQIRILLLCCKFFFSVDIWHVMYAALMVLVRQINHAVDILYYLPDSVKKTEDFPPGFPPNCNIEKIWRGGGVKFLKKLWCCVSSGSVTR